MRRIAELGLWCDVSRQPHGFAKMLVTGVVLTTVVACYPRVRDEARNVVLPENRTVTLTAPSGDVSKARSPGACKIVFGNFDKSYEVNVELAPGETREDPTLGGLGWRYVYSTVGPCHFVVYRNRNFVGSAVILGTNLTGRIRAGNNGVLSRERGGRGTWRAQSLRIVRPNTNGSAEGCQIEVGDNQRKMTYFSSVESVPAMGAIKKTLGRNCKFIAYAKEAFAGRYQYAFPGIEDYDGLGFYAKFPIRSFQIEEWRQDNCPRRARIPSRTGEYEGRCLPSARMPERNGVDSDRDGVEDNVERWAAETFVPELIYDSRQYRRPNDGRPENAKMPYQVFALDANLDRLEIVGALLWTEDRGWGTSALGLFSNKHIGDYSDISVSIERATTGSVYYVPSSIRLWHHARWQDKRSWSKRWDARAGGDNRGFDFNETHARVFLSSQKHHVYTDIGWQHQNSPYSWAGIDENVDGKGMVALPSPMVNVGNRDYPLVKSTRGISVEFADYDFWTSNERFCGRAKPGSSRNCSSVLGKMRFTKGRCAAPSWCPEKARRETSSAKK